MNIKEIALNDSIKHWKNNLVATDIKIINVYADACPLCAIYNDTRNDEAAEGCKGCPIQKRTGLPECEGTPWVFAENALNKWIDEHYRWQRGDSTKKEVEKKRTQFRLGCKAQIKFLESLEN